MTKLAWALALGSLMSAPGWCQDLAPKAGETIETVVVELGPEGFYPREIQRKSREKFYLFLRVTHGQGLTASRLENAAGVVVKQTESARSVRRWTQLVEVAPGKYSLRAPGVTDRVLSITIP